MKNRKQTKAIPYFIIVTFVVMILFWTWDSGFAGKNSFYSGKIVELADEWILNDGQKLSMPVKNQGHAELKKILPKVEDTDCLLIDTHHTAVEVFLDDEQIYQFGDDGKVFFSQPVSHWNFIPLREEYSGKTLKIKDVTNKTSYDSVIHSVYLGEKASLFLMVLKKSAGVLSCSILILCISLFILVFWILIGKRMELNQLFYFAIFGFFLALLGILETKLPQLLFGRIEFFNVVMFEILIFLPIPFILFYSYFDWEKNHIMGKLLVFPVANFIVCNLVELFHWKDFSYTAILSYGILFLLAFSLVFLNFHYRKRKVKGKYNLEIIGELFLSVTIFITFLVHYKSDNAIICAYIGVLVYIGCFVMQISESIFSNIDIGKKAALYEELAYHDKMTGLWNRTAYQEYLNELQDLGLENIENVEGYGAFAFDLNNLKKINDCYGHDRGDRYIIENANYLSKELEDIGRVYRTGGDEFMCIFDPSVRDLAEKCAEKMEEHMLKHKDLGINFSFGIAICNKEQDSSFNDTIKRADAEMYIYKKAHKAERKE